MSQTYVGAPLTGIIRGTAGNDQYVGTTDGNPAIVEAFISDPGGDDLVRAHGAHRGALINASKFDFTQSRLNFSAEMSGGYYGRTIFNSEIITGSRGSDVTISSIENNGVGFNWFTAAADGLKMVGGSGIDDLKINVINVGEDAFGLRSSDLNLGMGDDNIAISVNATSQSSAAIFNSILDLGGGKNTLSVVSSQKGILGTELNFGDGDDYFFVDSDLHSLFESSLHLGGGADIVSLSAPNDFNYNLLNSIVDLGAGDDKISLHNALDSAIDGGDGIDRLILPAQRDNYVIDDVGSGNYVILSNGSDASRFNISNFEYVQFSDITIQLGEAPKINHAPIILSTYVGGGFTNVPVPDANLIAINGSLSATAELYEAGTVLVQYAYAGGPPVAFASYFGDEADDFTNWTDGKNISEFVSIQGGKNEHTITVLPGAGIASEAITVNVSSLDPVYVYPWYGVLFDVGGKLLISGAPVQGRILTVNTDVITDKDGLGPFSYQWLRDGSEIANANALNYTLTKDDIGATVSVKVSYADGGGTLENVYSTSTSSVEAALVSDPAFDIVLSSTSGNVATFEVYATEVADAGDPGIEDLQFVLSHNTADMTIDGASISTATGITAVPNLNQAAGTLTLAGFALPPFTDLNTPVLTFEATILNEETPLTIAIDDIFADDTAHPRIEEQFNFSSLEISTTVSDRFGNALPDAVVSAYEVQIGDDLFLREVSSSDTSSVFAIVAKPKEAVSSIDFDLLDNAGLIDFQVGSALSGWSIQSNTNTPDTVSFAGFGAVNGSQDLVAGQETVLATFTTSTDPDFVIDGIFLNTTAQADISVGEIPAASKTGNVTVHQVARGSDVYLDADKPIDEASDKAITANDALQALRLAVGLTKSDGTAAWHDYIAADINKDGQVTANDALNILKFAVGLTDGPSADWVFVDGDADWSTIGRRDTNYEEGVWLENIVADTSVNMTGILVGDVNGSYLGTGGAVPAPVPFSVSINGDQISFANLVDGVIRFVETTSDVMAVFGTGMGSAQQYYPLDALSNGISDKTLVVAAGQTLEISIAELQNVYVEGVRVTGAGNVVITATDPQIADDNQILVNVDLQGGNLTFDLPDDNDVIVVKTGSIIDLAGGTLIVDDGIVDARLAQVVDNGIGGIVVNSKLVITHDQFIALESELFISGNGTVEVVVDDVVSAAEVTPPSQVVVINASVSEDVIDFDAYFGASTQDGSEADVWLGDVYVGMNASMTGILVGDVNGSYVA